jgi:hypothetical protein
VKLDAERGGDRKSDQADNLSTRSFAADQADGNDIISEQWRNVVDALPN